MSILTDFLAPSLQFPKTLLVIDGVDEEDCGDALVEGTHQRAEEFLPRLSLACLTVSQICSLTCGPASMGTTLVAYSTPTVTW